MALGFRASVFPPVVGAEAIVPPLILPLGPARLPFQDGVEGFQEPVSEGHDSWPLLAVVLFLLSGALGRTSSLCFIEDSEASNIISEHRDL